MIVNIISGSLCRCAGVYFDKAEYFKYGINVIYTEKTGGHLHATEIFTCLSFSCGETVLICQLKMMSQSSRLNPISQQSSRRPSSPR